MRGNFLYFLVFFNFIVQSTLLQMIRINGVIPNTALILIVVISILYGQEKGIVSGLIAGFFQDVFFSKALGVNLLIYFLIAYIIGGLKSKLYKDNFLTPLILLLLSTMFYHFLYFILMYFLKQGIDFMYILKNVFLLEAILNILIGLVTYKFFYEHLHAHRLR